MVRLCDLPELKQRSRRGDLPTEDRSPACPEMSQHPFDAPLGLGDRANSRWMPRRRMARALGCIMETQERIAQHIETRRA